MISLLTTVTALGLYTISIKELNGVEPYDLPEASAVQIRAIERAKSHKGLKVHSRCELACIRALEKYCVPWEAIEGDTYQRHIGFGKYADFYIKGRGDRPAQIIEFHPILPHRELKTKDYQRYKELSTSLRKNQKHDLAKFTKRLLLEHYTSKREWTMRKSSEEEINEATLIVVTDAGGFFDEVIIPNATFRLPTRKEFCRKFNKQRF